MIPAEQRATWRKEAEHHPGHLTHTRILALLDEVEAVERERDKYAVIAHVHSGFGGGPSCREVLEHVEAERDKANEAALQMMFSTADADFARRQAEVEFESLQRMARVLATQRDDAQTERDSLRAGIEALVERAERGADAWGACHEEWLRIDELRALLAGDGA